MASSRVLSAALVLLPVVVACSSEVDDVDVKPDVGDVGVLTKDAELVPTGKGAGVYNKFQQGESGSRTSTSSSNGIYYHAGAPVMLAPTVYYIWYGNWSDSSKSILTDLAKNLGGSPYYNINTTYYATDRYGLNKHNLQNVVTFGADTSVGFTHGTVLTDANIQTIVAEAINGAALPKDPNGVYFVLTSSEVQESSGFCSQYCGWHTHFSMGTTDIKYAFVGNASTQCPSACSIQPGLGPNGDPGPDAMASVVSHELEEAASDPDLNAWYDRRGYENADKCAWTFGTMYDVTLADGTTKAKANMKLGTRDYLIQRNWVNANGGYCDTHY
jgi:hypothetical protein